MVPAHILVVDDDPAIRKSLASFLSDHGYEVSSAENAEKALDILSEKPHDLAVVDMRLPGMNGDAMIVRANEIQPCLRFLIFTGSINCALSEQLKVIGLRQENVFYKPLPDMSVLIDGIEKLLEGKEDALAQ